MPPFLLGVDTEPMEAKSVEALPTGEHWKFEPKWDGFRCLVFKAGREVDLRAKSGKSLARYFPEMMETVRSINTDDFVLDGELTVPNGETLSFGALQDRVHPASSRIAKLSVETPALLILFDCLATAKTGSLIGAPLADRRSVLKQMMGRLGETTRMHLSPQTCDLAEAQRWLDVSHGALDGVVAKRTDKPYAPGARAMLKVKKLRTADCVVGGFRYARGAREVGSLLLGLYDSEGRLNHVRFTSAISRIERPALTARLEALRGGPGFTGNAPGGASRWSTDRSSDWQPLRTELVVEVTYDQVTDGRFRHGTMLCRWRPDKAPRQCTFEQLQQELRPSRLVEDLVTGGGE
jgi:ATP-dependent DNA ligase